MSFRLKQTRRKGAARRARLIGPRTRTGSVDKLSLSEFCGADHGHGTRITNTPDPSPMPNGRITRQLRPQAPLQLLAQLRDFHPRHHDELAAQHFPRFVVVRQLARYAAILAILVPAKPSVRNR